MIQLSTDQIEVFSQQSIDRFVRRLHDHQCRAGLVPGSDETYPDREECLRGSVDTALTLGFTTELHVALVADLILLHGTEKVTRESESIERIGLTEAQYFARLFQAFNFESAEDAP